MNIRIDEGIAPIELVLAAAHIGARIECRGGDYVLTRRNPVPDHRVPLAHYTGLLDQVKASVGSQGLSGAQVVP